MVDEPENESAEEQSINHAWADFLRAQDEGQLLDRDAFLQQHPEIAGELQELLRAVDQFENYTDILQDAEASENTTNIDPSEQTLPHISAVSELQNRKAWLESDGKSIKLPCKFGNYVLEKLLGKGGMGVVYQAMEESLQRRVAIKMIRAGHLADEREVQRFYAEARSVARLDHPNIVTVYQCGECDHHHYFTMDLVNGTDLAKRLKEGVLDNKEAAQIVATVAKAIAYAHKKGVVHRDLKPANVLIDLDGNIVVTDFGLAKIMHHDSGLTKSGAALGTPSYMAPEQAAGKSDDHSELVDVYSLGAVLFACLVGRPPFQGATPLNTILDVIHRPPPQVRQLNPNVHRDLETICDKCLQKTPERRYQSASELAEDLERFVDGRPILAKPLSLLQKSTYWLAGIPIVSALTGFRGHTEKSHHWVQRGLIFGLLLTVCCIVWGPVVQRWWRDSHLPRNLAIGAGTVDGTYYAMATSLASTFPEGSEIQVIATEGSEDNRSRLMDGTIELGLVQADAIRDKSIALVAPLFFETVHVLIKPQSNIAALTDLRGKKVLLGPKNSGMNRIARRLLADCNIPISEIDAVNMDWFSDDLPEDLDAAIVVIRTGHQKINEALAAGDLEFLPITDAIDLSLEEPTFRVARIRAEDYPAARLNEPVQTLATAAFLATRADASAMLVQSVLRSLYEPQRDDIIPLRSATHWLNAFYHPMARDYFEKKLQEVD